MGALLKEVSYSKLKSCTCLQVGKLAPGLALCLLFDCPSPLCLIKHLPGAVLGLAGVWGAGVFSLVNEKVLAW